jgi:hypothetical protein
MAERKGKEVAAVQGRDLVDLKSLGQRGHARIYHLQPRRRGGLPDPQSGSTQLRRLATAAGYRAEMRGLGRSHAAVPGWAPMPIRSTTVVVWPLA